MKTVLITGAAQGLGEATANYFLSQGYQVVATDVKFGSILDERKDRNLVTIPLDVSSNESIQEAAVVLKSLGITIDVLINNAGIFELYPLSEIETERFERLVSINTFGSVRMIRTFLPDLVKNRGRVVQISSESVKYPGLFQPYQVSKLALEAYSKSVRQELAIHGVRLIIIRPGAIQTELSSRLDSYQNPVNGSIYKSQFDAFVKKTTKFVGRIITPAEAARFIFRVVNCRNPRYIYRINNNPLLTFLSLAPGRWTDRVVLFLVGKAKSAK